MKNEWDFKPRITVYPQTVLIDEKVNMELAGFYPQQLVTIRVKAKQVFMVTPSNLDVTATWEGYANFVTDQQGKINVATAKPLIGTYFDIDQMGLFWSMQMVDSVFNWYPTFSVEAFPAFTETKIIAELNGHIVATEVLKRFYYSSEIKITNLKENGLVGKFFYSPNRQQPGIIVLGGAEGGLRSSQYFAGLLASHGYSVLALAYFGMENLPPLLYKIPLEYFQKAISWLQKQRQVYPDRVGIMGYSKGGELALLLGAKFSQVKAVVAYTPSGISFQGIGEWATNGASWTCQGKDLPFVDFNYPLLPFSYFQKPFLKPNLLKSNVLNPAPLENLYRVSLLSKEAVEKATIPVEKVNGPILMVSASDDAVLPSKLLANSVMERLRVKGYSHSYYHYSYEGAGHLITFPYVPTTMNIWCGGNAKDNAFANADSWEKILDFLRKNL